MRNNEHNQLRQPSILSYLVNITVPNFILPLSFVLHIAELGGLKHTIEAVSTTCSNIKKLCVFSVCLL
jgi:hypothetical protein